MKKVSLLFFIITILVISSCKKSSSGNSGPALTYVGNWNRSSIVLQLTAANTYQGVAGTTYTAGKYSVSGSRITFTDTAGYCGFYPNCIYTYSLNDSTLNGTQQAFMTLTMVNDSCSFRNTDLPGVYMKQ